MDNPFAPERWHNARVIPPTAYTLNGETGRVEYDGGLYDETGALIDAGRHRGGFTKNVPAATSDERPKAVLKGRYFFGGWLRDHFGHFINESLGRFWAYGPDGFDGVIFMLYGKSRQPPRRLASWTDKFLQRPFIPDAMACLGVDAPLHLIGQPTQVESLVVPRQFFLEDTHAGVPGSARTHQETFLRMARSPRVAALPGVGDRIYLSRARLRPIDGKFILEDFLEDNLSRSGYAIVYPECLSLAEQIAVYANARTMIFAEGSTIHLGAPFCSGDKSVAIISRRFPPASGFVAQVAAMGCAKLLVIAERRGYVSSFIAARTPAPLLKQHRTERAVNLRTAHVLLDFEKLGARLAEGGFIDLKDWAIPDEELVRDSIAASIGDRAQALPEMDHRYVDAPRSIPKALRRFWPRTGRSARSDS